MRPPPVWAQNLGLLVVVVLSGALCAWGWWAFLS